MKGIVRNPLILDLIVRNAKNLAYFEKPYGSATQIIWGIMQHEINFAIQHLDEDERYKSQKALETLAHNLWQKENYLSIPV